MRRFAAVSVAVLCAAATSTCAEVRIPLVVEEQWGSHRPGIPVSSGVPLLPGQVTDVSKLALVDAKGTPVVAQFRPLARWWRNDSSLRWVLVDFKARVGTFGRRTYFLTDRGGAPTDSPLKVASTDEQIVVTTGPAQFTIRRKRFNLFDRVRLDVNGDGQFTEDEEAVSPNADGGSVVTDTHGLKYFGSEGTTLVKVEEAGPVRVCVLAKGTHRARGGTGYSLGMYGYEIRMHFTAGVNVVKLDVLITNNGPQPNGSPTFEDFSLVGQCNVTATSPTDGGKLFKKWGPLYRLYGVAPIVDTIPPGESRMLYQDSVGSEHWKRNCGLEVRGGAESPSSFRGYRILARGADGEKVLHAGDHARGLAQLAGERFGVTLVPKYFWQLFPKGIELSHDGTWRAAIFPAEYKTVHWIDDAGAAGQVLLLNFFARDQKPQWARDRSRQKWGSYHRQQPWPHVIDDFNSGPLFARTTNEQYAATGALADIGPYLPIDPENPAGPGGIDTSMLSWHIVGATREFPLELTDRRYFMTDYLKGNAYGWQVFGCRWEEHRGHSPWNYEPIGTSYLMFHYINTGGRSFYEFGLRRCKQARDIRACKIEGTDLWHFKRYRDWAANNVVEDWAKRTTLQPSGPEVAKYTQGKYSRFEWHQPDPAHTNLDEWYDLYCLTGDQRAFETLENIAGYGGAFVGTDRPVSIHRMSGWNMRALLRYYDLTGDENALNYLEPALTKFWQIARKARTQAMIANKNEWFVDIFSRAVVQAHKLTGDERMRDLAIGLARGRGKLKSYWHTLHAFCWEQTGRAEYFYEKWPAYARLGGYYPACSGFMWSRPRDDKAAPAAVTDLKAEAADGGVTLTWTAPGDDGATGAAAVYQIKYDDLPLVETSHSKQTVNFWAAINCTGEPTPAAAGAAQRFVVKGLAAGTYHFALKSRDEVSNESGLSNVVRVTLP